MYCPGCAQLTHQSDLVCPYCTTPLTAIRENFQGQPSFNTVRIRLKKLGIIFCALTLIWPIFITFLSETTDYIWGTELPLMDPLMILTPLFLLTGLAMLIYIRAVYPLPPREDSFFQHLKRRLFNTNGPDTNSTFVVTTNYLTTPEYQPSNLYNNDNLALPAGDFVAISAPTRVNSLSHPLAEVASAPNSKTNKLAADSRPALAQSEPLVENSTSNP